MGTAFSLNPGQERAVAAAPGQPVRVVAGAGTGKTEVVSRRFIYLLTQNAGWRPEHILVLTFSEKAAAEMRARIFRAVTGAGLGFSRLDLAAASISTFHSFSARLLGDHSLMARIDPAVPMLTEIDAQRIVDEARAAFLEHGFEAAYGEFDPLGASLYDWKEGGPFELARGLMSQLRNQAVSPEAFRERLKEAAQSEHHRTLGPLVDWLYAAYAGRLAARGQLDFDRLIVDAASVVQGDPALRRTLHERFKAILVDEYQDTNFAQEKLLQALARDGMGGVTVVGDPRQAIYVWREARVENIARFPGAAGMRVDAPLTENRRSLRPILAVANRAIEGYEFDTRSEFDPTDILIPSADNDRAEGTVVNLVAARTRDEEAQAVAGWIRQLRAEGYAYRDVAVILRARTYLQPYLDAMAGAGIPFELSSADAFYTRPEILDAVHLLRACLDPSDEVSLTRSLLGPAAGLSQSQMAVLRRAGKRPLWRAVMETAEAGVEEVRARLSRFAAFWAEAQRQRWALSPAMFVDWAMRQSGLHQRADAVGRRGLSRLMAVAHDYESSHPAETLAGLVDHLRLVIEGDPREKAPELNGDADAVRILTAHASKGLEFPAVIAADCRQKVKPNRDFAPFHDPDAGLIFPDSKSKTHAPEFEARVRRARNEARCLWYVTLTRARRRLIITAASAKTPGEGGYDKVDTFFEELWNKEVEGPTPGVALGAAPERMEGAAEAAGPGVEVEESDVMEAARALRAGLARRLRPARPLFNVSPTAFMRWRSCPAAYRFYYQSGLSPLSAGDDADRVEWMGAAGLGALFHAALALHGANPAASAAALVAIASERARGRLTAEQVKQVEGWVQGYFETEAGRAAPGVDQVAQALSWQLDFEEAGLRLSGTLDQMEPERMVVYNTGEAADPAGLLSRYGDQARLYAMLAQRAGRVEPGAALFLFHAHSGSMVPVPFSAGDEARLEGELRAFARWLEDEESAARPVPGDLCRWCAARETLCEEGRSYVSR